MACPICSSPEGSLINDGIRAGAAVMIFVSSVVIGAIVRFAWRLYRSELQSSFAEATEDR